MLKPIFASMLFLFSLGCAAPDHEPVHFLYSGEGITPEVRILLEQREIEGVQIIYNWRMLEPEKNVYDISAIERDLAELDGLGKKLFVQIQDRFFEVHRRNIPDYVQTDPIYAGGLVPQFDDSIEGARQQQGWTTAQWNPNVRKRFQALLAALGERFDGRIHGLNLPESSIGDPGDTDKTGFTCDRYFEATLENIRAARSVFTSSYVVQYTNFWPCEWNNDQGYMEGIFEDAAAHGYGLGGPDIIPFRRPQMNNSYQFFNAYRGRLAIVAMAIQEPTLNNYVNPETERPYTREEFIDFAADYLGVDIIFWTTQAPGLNEP